MANVTDSTIDLGAEQLARVVKLEGDALITWPTALDEKNVVQNLVDVLTSDSETEDWPTDVVANLSRLTVQEFMEAEEPFLRDDQGIVRFNAGSVSDGFSVTNVIEDNRTALQGVFDPKSKPLIRKVIDCTIIDSAKDKVDQIVELIPA